MMDPRHAIRETLVAAASAARLSAPTARQQSNDIIAAILREIDRTVLARRLHLRFEDGTEVQLSVRNRRLHSIAASGSQLDAVFNRALGPGDAHDIVQALSAICKDKSLTRLRTSVDPAEPETASLGVSTARLSLSAGSDKNQRDPGQPRHDIEHVLHQHAAEIVAAYCLLGEDVTAIFGEDSDVDAHFDDILDLFQTVTDPDFILGQMLNTHGIILTPHPMIAEGCIGVIGSIGVTHAIVFRRLSVADVWGILPPTLR